MKAHILTVTVCLLFSGLGLSANVQRGVEMSSDKEVREANKDPNTAGQSDYRNSPTQINKQRMEENPSGTSSDPTNWPHGSAMESMDEKIND